MLQQLGVRKKVYIGGLIFEPERKAISPVGAAVLARVSSRCDHVVRGF